MTELLSTTRDAATRRWVVILTGVGSLMAALDTLVVANALSTIRRDLHASLSQLEWTVNAYNLSFAVLLVAAAALGDRFGRRALYATGLALFAAASAGCALAGSVGVLIVMRALQGAGAALVTTLGLALLTAAFPPEKRGAALGLFSAVTGISVALGPVVGGAVVQGLDWQWIFWVNVPIGLVAAPLVLRRVPEGYGPQTRIDVPGLALVSASSFALVWALVRANTVGWAKPEIVTMLAGGVALAIAFLAWERRAAAPMLPPELFRVRAFSAGNAAMFFTTASLFSCVFFISQLLQVGLHYGPLGAGVRMMAWTATFITVAPGVGLLIDRIGERPLLTIGLTLQAVGILWLAEVAKAGMGYGSTIGPFIVGGVGVSMAIPSGQSSAISAVGEDAIGKAAGANSTMRELGGVFGIATTVAVFASRGSYASGDAFLHGFRAAMFTAAGISLAGAVAGALLPTRRPATVSVAPQPVVTQPEPVLEPVP